MSPTPSDKSRVTTRLAASLPGGVAAVLLAGAVVFGATVIRPAIAEQQEPAQEPAAASVPTKVVGYQYDSFPAPKRSQEPQPKPTEEEQPEATVQPKQEEAAPTAKPEQPVATAKPQPKPDPTDKPKPVTTALELEAWVKEGKVKLAWNPYNGDGFEYYKVVRSKDATVTWPASGDDEVIGVIGDPSAPYMVDKAPCGKQLHYRVFAVRHGSSGYETLAASNVAPLFLECGPTPTQGEVYQLAFEVRATDKGIKLAWEKCGSDGFVAYKIVRSKVHTDPRFPVNDGTELIGVVGDPGATTWIDADVASGEAWTYRVVAVARDGNGGYLILCQTAATSATAL